MTRAGVQACARLPLRRHALAPANSWCARWKLPSSCRARTLQGDGKTSAVRAWAHSNPLLLYADICTSNSYLQAVTEVAKAIGYDVSRDADLGPGDLRHILNLYNKACRQLKDEGKLQAGGVPVLVLDHCTRPLTKAGPFALARGRNVMTDDLDHPQLDPCGAQMDTLTTAFLDAAKDAHECLLCLVTGDEYAEKPDFRSEC